jgi:hypothetical protein
MAVVKASQIVVVMVMLVAIEGAGYLSTRRSQPDMFDKR